MIIADMLQTVNLQTIIVNMKKEKRGNDRNKYQGK
jgi:hypothetical protein